MEPWYSGESTGLELSRKEAFSTLPGFGASCGLLTTSYLEYTDEFSENSGQCLQRCNKGHTTHLLDAASYLCQSTQLSLAS